MSKSKKKTADKASPTVSMNGTAAHDDKVASMQRAINKKFEAMRKVRLHAAFDHFDKHERDALDLAEFSEFGLAMYPDGGTAWMKEAFKLLESHKGNPFGYSMPKHRRSQATASASAPAGHTNPERHQKPKNGRAQKKNERRSGANGSVKQFPLPESFLPHV